MKTLLLLITCLFIVYSNDVKVFVVCDLCNGKGCIFKHTKQIICPECGNKKYCCLETNFKSLSG